ncbi:unnamed protein product [[Candida] boidinii]|nr:unnamed protein product [[Candida] boidinii]
MENGFLKKDNPQLSRLLKQHEKCQNAINNPPEDDNSLELRQCENVLNVLLTITKDENAAKDQQCINLYDFRLKDSYPSCGANWPPDLETVTPFLRNEKVLDKLNLKKKSSWSECSNIVGRKLKATRDDEAYKLLPNLLGQLPIVLFSGANDIICNSLSTEMLIDELKWNNQKGFTDEKIFSNWMYDGEFVGEITSESNLTYIKIFNSSHMVPFDLPDISRGLFDIISNTYKFSNISDNNIIKTPVYDVENREYYFDDKAEDDFVYTIQNSTDILANGSNDINSTTVYQGETSDSSNEKDTNGDAKSSDNDKNSFTNITFKAFEVLTVGVLIYGLFYLYKVYSSRPSSILSPKSGAIGLGKFVKSTRNNKKKTVHWSDELVDYVETEANMSSDSTNNNAIAAGVSLNYADNNVNTIDENLQDLSEGYSNINNNNKDSNMLGKMKKMLLN